jgi:hypothetical protein
VTENAVIQREGFTEHWPIPYAEIPERYTVVRQEWDGTVRRIIEWKAL